MPKANGAIFDISVQLDEAGIRKGLTDLTAYCKTVLPIELCNKVNLCVEELLINIAQHGGRDAGHFTDIKVISDAHVITASIRDDGRAFNPVACSEKKQQTGLKLLHAKCDDMNYRYSFGQNMTVLKWKY